MTFAALGARASEAAAPPDSCDVIPTSSSFATSDENVGTKTLTFRAHWAAVLDCPDNPSLDGAPVQVRQNAKVRLPPAQGPVLGSTRMSMHLVGHPTADDLAFRGRLVGHVTLADGVGTLTLNTTSIGDAGSLTTWREELDYDPVDGTEQSFSPGTTEFRRCVYPVCGG